MASQAGKTAKYMVGTFLMLSIILSFGLLSFTGLLVIYPSFAIAVLAFLLNALVEGEIYRQNIFKGLSKLFKKRSSLHTLIIQELHKCLDEHIEKSKLANKKAYDDLSDFMRKYMELRKFLDSLKDKELTPETERRKKIAKKILKTMQSEFIQAVVAKRTGQSQQVLLARPRQIDANDKILKQVRAVLPSLEDRVLAVELLTPVYILAGFTFGLVMVSTLQSSLMVSAVALGITLPTPVFPILAVLLATLAAISYTIMIYYTVSKIIHSAAWERWIKTLQDLYSKGDDSYLRYTLRVMGVTLLAAIIVAVGIAATFATAGTWWSAVNATIKLVPAMMALARFVRVVVIALIAITFATNLSFTVKSSIKSLEKISNKVAGMLKMTAKGWFNYFFAGIRKTKKQENWVQFLNPIRIIIKLIEIPYYTAVFIGHAIAMGLTADKVQINGVDLSKPATGAGMFIEFLEDYGFLVGHDEDEHDSKDGKHHHHGDDDGDNKHHHHHEHSKIPDYLLTILLSPLKLASALWDYVASQFNAGDPKKPVLSFSQACEKAFNIKHEKPVNKMMPQAVTENVHDYFDRKIEKKIDTQAPRSSTGLINQEVADAIKRQIRTTPNKEIKLQDFEHLLPKAVSDTQQANRARFFNKLNKRTQAAFPAPVPSPALCA